MSTAADNITLQSWLWWTSCSHRFYQCELDMSQYVKLDIGAEIARHRLHIKSTSCSIFTVLNPNWTTVPVGGGTGGQDINVNAQITVGNVNFVALAQQLIKFSKVFPPIYVQWRNHRRMLQIWYISRGQGIWHNY